MTQAATCPHCDTMVRRADRFCEGCGASLSEVRRVAIPRHETAKDAPCADCGNAADFDEYCSVCGHRREEPDRDEATVGPVVLVTDRGIEHARNEDAAAAAILLGGDGQRPEAIVVAVCDGVSSSDQAQIAAAAASQAGVSAMITTLAAGKPGRAAMLAGLDAAAAAASAAGGDAASAPSCTYTAAVVVPTTEGTAQITLGNVGDSRAYWLPEPPGEPRQLTVDDSLAQELITAGAAPDSYAVQRGAHTLTRWLGADSEPQPWSDSSVQTINADGPGTLLLCSDGLWNYLPDPADIARFCNAADPGDAARALTQFALDGGGQDNITVAVIPIGGPNEFG
ncbi:PP2C family serine/threonine-protein phosphatase [Mycobacterium sp. 3519A]|jgi:serine/threonine protein phosphatase PrpC|uniref:PP2C family protein-serine/threonine phosphatase n=1 Tax=Mycobacterium sp. 3519A TaxID=2057184 RepID=UPI000C7BC4CF|nr:PP2C family serine/threonine-protein phosphatase [Mycobacterium sp. 3519A]